MGGEVRVLLLLGLLHWVGGSEGRKTWRRRGQQPPQPPPPPPPPQRAEVAPGAGQPVESFPLDFTAVEGNMDSFMAQVKSLAQSLYPCSAQQLNEDLRLHLLLNTSVTRNRKIILLLLHSRNFAADMNCNVSIGYEGHLIFDPKGVRPTG